MVNHFDKIDQYRRSHDRLPDVDDVLGGDDDAHPHPHRGDDWHDHGSGDWGDRSDHDGGDGRLHAEWLLQALLLGMVGALLGLLTVVFIGIFRNVGARLRARLDARWGRRVATVALPVIGGLMYGLIAVALPLTLGDGMAQLRCVVKNANGPNRLVFAGGGGGGGGGDAKDSGTFSLAHLCLTMLGKMVAMSASLGLGFVGGQVRHSITIKNLHLLMSGACMLHLIKTHFTFPQLRTCLRSSLQSSLVRWAVWLSTWCSPPYRS